MAKIKITFNGITYALEEANLTDAYSKLSTAFADLTRLKPSEGLAYTLNGNRASYSVAKGTCTDTDIVIASEYEGLPVTNILEYAFHNYDSLTSVTIPDSVTSIGNNAFYGCISLTSVTIPDSVTRISNNAFYNCISLTSVYITDIAKWCGISFDSVNSNPLYYANNLYLNGELVTELVIPDSVTSINNHAFHGYTSLTSLIISNSVKRISNNAFQNCASLTSVTIPDSVTTIGDNAFYGCNSLTNITIPDSVTSIGSSVFSGCSSLTSLTIPFLGANKNDPSKGFIGYSFGAATAYTNQESVPLSLQIVIVTNPNYISNYAFYNCTSLTSVTIGGNGVTYIGNFAFSSCDNLTSVTIPDSVTSIGQEAFAYSKSLTSVTIPSNVTTIGKEAFAYSRSLTDITFKSTIAQWNSITFNKDWNAGVPATYVQCSDGQVAL